MQTTQVLIVGGGPVGMTLAAALAHRGIRSILVERNFTTTAHPKMDITNARSMELFRTIGLVDALRAVAVPVDHCFDVSWITDFAGDELHRFAYPSVTEHQANIRKRNDGTQPAESPMRVSQVEIEPVLRTHIEAHPLVDVRFGIEFIDLSQDAGGVTTTVLDKTTETICRIRCAYLVGCDGGGSKVRGSLNIGLTGDSKTMQRFMVHFRSPRKDLLMRWGNAWHYQSAAGTLIAQNDDDVWTLHARLADDSSDKLNPGQLVNEFVGTPIEHEILVANPWVPHLLVANAYRKGRVLLAGDAAHQYIPTGGYGMNTGVGEAFDLGWKLAAMFHGFGGQCLLDAYEMERRPIAMRNCDASRRHNNVRRQIGDLYTPELFATDASGEQVRRATSQRIIEFGNAENESWGIEWGYCYTDSPIVEAEQGVGWVDDPLHYAPTATPGARLPSIFLPDGQSLFDRLGPWFTLLLPRPGSSNDAFESVSRTLGIPLRTLKLDLSAYDSIYRSEAILVRPDHHVAWAGALPANDRDVSRILRRALGFNSDL